VVDEHADAAAANSQTIVVEAAEVAKIQVHGDEIRLHQVLNNYLSNAVKYSGPGRIELRARILKHGFGR
jgi:signal transduction histidine kinase